MTIRTPLPPPGYIPSEMPVMFRVHERTIARWRRTGYLKYYLTPGGEARYPRDTTDALLAARQAKR